MNKYLPKLKYIKPSTYCLLSILLSLSSLANSTKNILAGTNFLANSISTSLSVKLKPKSSLIFNGFIYNSKALKFENFSSTDSIITKTINIIRPTNLFYLESKLNNGKIENSIESLLLFPGDNILIDNQTKKVISSTGISTFIDRIINIPSQCYPIPKTIKNINTKDQLRDIFNRYISNQQIINKLNIGNIYKDALSQLNLIIKYQLISQIPFKIFSSIELKQRDSLNNEMLGNAELINSINSSFKQDIFYNLISFNAFKNDKSVDLNNIWKLFDKVDIKIKESHFYQEYLVSAIIGTFKYKPEYLKEISQILTQAKNANNPALDTLRPITTYLLQTLTDFQKAKTNLKSFNNGKYSFILNNEVEANHEVRYITSLSKTNIIDTNNNVFPIQNIFNDPRFKLFVIDVWACWCIPCIKEFPFLKKYENEYKDKPIKFITLSIDKEIDAKQWKQNASKINRKR